MDLDEFIQLSTYGIEISILVSAPVLLFGLLAGVGVSIFQAATQINDAALAFIPKIAAAVFALAYFGPWMIAKMATFAIYTFNQIPQVVH